jgi:trehalose 6-phosphate phosphatase
MTTLPGLQRLIEDLRECLPRASAMLLALDFDGTLAPIVPCPEDARVPQETSDLLLDLARSGCCTVAIVSGRSLNHLKPRMGDEFICVGNHGLEIEGPGLSFLHPEANGLRHLVDHASWDFEAAFEAVRGVRVERKVFGLTVHYRQAHRNLVYGLSGLCS